ncbi:MAG: hypothetical protein KBD00_00265 [Candidatus Peribacteraceae bacterium]|nr:hypothetical protein [Candidatus Peribacteraceae bacterium]MBP9773046.1 hypothetical protein [Candidatus Peribacteraceae bacterium]
MLHSFSVRKKSGLILAGILAVTGITTAYQPPTAHGTNDCTTEWAAVEAAYSSLNGIDSSMATLSGSIYSLRSSMATIIEDTSDMLETFYATATGSEIATSSTQSLASSTNSVASANFVSHATMSGSVASLQSSWDALYETIDYDALDGALEDYDVCMAA